MREGNKKKTRQTGSKCSEIVFGCHQNSPESCSWSGCPGAGPGRASVDQAFWQVGKIVRELGGSWRPQRELGWVLPGSVSAKWAGRRRRWLRSERFAPGCRGTRSSGVSDGSPGVPPLCVWTCASSGRSPVGRRDMQKPSRQRMQFPKQPLEDSPLQPQPGAQVDLGMSSRGSIDVGVILCFAGVQSFTVVAGRVGQD